MGNCRKRHPRRRHRGRRPGQNSGVPLQLSQTSPTPSPSVSVWSKFCMRVGCSRRTCSCRGCSCRGCPRRHPRRRRPGKSHGKIGRCPHRCPKLSTKPGDQATSSLPIPDATPMIVHLIRIVAEECERAARIRERNRRSREDKMIVEPRAAVLVRELDSSRIGPARRVRSPGAGRTSQDVPP